jgi:hypothetical protein
MSKSVKLTAEHHEGRLPRDIFTNPENTLLQIRILGLMATDVPTYQHTPDRLANRLSADVKAVRKALKGLQERGLVSYLPGIESSGRGSDWRMHWPPLDVTASPEVDVHPNDGGRQTPGPTPGVSDHPLVSQESRASESGKEAKLATLASPEAAAPEPEPTPVATEAPARTTAPVAEKPKRKLQRRADPLDEPLWSDPAHPHLAEYRQRLDASGFTLLARNAQEVLGSLLQVESETSPSDAMAFLDELFTKAKAPYSPQAVDEFGRRWAKDMVSRALKRMRPAQEPAEPAEKPRVARSAAKAPVAVLGGLTAQEPATNDLLVDMAARIGAMPTSRIA